MVRSLPVTVLSGLGFFAYRLWLLVSVGCVLQLAQHSVLPSTVLWLAGMSVRHLALHRGTRVLAHCMHDDQGCHGG